MVCENWRVEYRELDELKGGTHSGDGKLSYSWV